MDSYDEANAVLSKFCKGYMELKKDLPIRPSEMAVLNIIVKRADEGKFTPLRISELLDVSKSMVTAHISVLKKKNYITKEPSAQDKRSFFVIPTEKARNLVEKAGESTKKNLQYLQKQLGLEDYEKLLYILCNANEALTIGKEMNENGLE